MAQSSIVVGTDGSSGARAAVGQAGRLAAALGARVVVVSAYSNGAVALAPEAMAYSGDQRESAEEILELAASELKAAGVECDTRAVCGSAAEAIIEVAQVEEAEAIVVGSRGMRGARRLLGSVPNAVSHKAPCTVMIVKTD